MAVVCFVFATISLALLVARQLYLMRRFARPELPGDAGLVRVVGRMEGPGAVEVHSGAGAPPFHLALAEPLKLRLADGQRVHVVTRDAVLDAWPGWGVPQALVPGRRLTVDGQWSSVARDGLYREAGREAALDAVRVVTGARPGVPGVVLPLVLAAAAVVWSLAMFDPLPTHMQATAGALRCPVGARLVTMTYSGNRGWVHACEKPDQALHGPWVSHFATGQLRRRARYQNGQLHGTELRWLSSGQLSSRTGYRQGKRHGELLVWHANGRLRLAGHYRDGRRHGPRFRLSESGAPVELSSYLHGRRHGRALWWSAGGSRWFGGSRIFSSFRCCARRSPGLGQPLMVDRGFRHGKPHGPFSVTFTGGGLGQGRFDGGRRAGLWTLTDAMGWIQPVWPESEVAPKMALLRSTLAGLR